VTKRVEIPAHVKLQIAKAAQWWADHRSLDQASRWLDEIELAIEGLTNSYMHHSIAPESNSFPTEVRQLLFGTGRSYTHRVLYQIHEDAVAIVAVLHRAQGAIERKDIQ
jgi:plasmid stabilization system protein ParE